MVHFMIEVNGVVRPLCGDWGGSPSWTTVRTAVSCHACLARLRGERLALVHSPSTDLLSTGMRRAAPHIIWLHP